MKRFLCAGVFALLTITVAHGQQSTSQGTPSQNMPPGLENRQQQPPGLQNRDQLPPGLAGRTNDNLNAQASNGAGNQLPQTGRENGTATTSQTGGTVQFRVGAMIATDQPIATQVQQVLTTEPVLAQTLPMLQISVNNGAIILDGNVNCAAEGVLIEHLCRERLPRTVRIENRFRSHTGPLSPAGVR